MSDDATRARYVVGIDLGTTNSALAYVDTSAADPRVRDFPIRQFVGPGETEVRSVLPSFAYEPAAGEFPEGAFTLPGGENGGAVVGEFARRHGALNPGRLLASAKSWLCHAGVNRTAPLLPWHGAPDTTRVSPVDASARYLAHLRAAWDAAFPAHPLATQEVVVTVPASFDEVARQLTVRAAEKAGLPELILLEEPQAAFYAWMAATEREGSRAMGAGHLTLVCDVGGGTSDFTLIEARPAEEGRVRFHRVAVGEHLLLGGDNMDLALAHHVEQRLSPGARLEPRRWSLLVQACRAAKETLLGPGAPERVGIAVAGGTRLIGGALHTEVTREEAHALLVEGFFPKVPLEARPSTVRSGFQEFGLPYAADAAVTRHLAAFLSTHLAQPRTEAATPAFPDRVLFNGGVFEAGCLRERLLAALESWRAAAGVVETGPLVVLPNERLDLAVARGAAYAAWLRRQPGRRIAAGLARSYHIQVGRGQAEPAAVCLAPAGLEEGQEVVLSRTFLLRLRQPVEFALFSSSTRLNDQVGDLVAIDAAQLTPLPPVRTVVSSGRSREAESVEVRLHARLTEIGTLDVRCVEESGRRSWKLEFDVRGAAPRREGGRAAAGVPSGGGEAVEQAVVEACRQQIGDVFAPGRGATEDGATMAIAGAGAAGAGDAPDPAALVRALERCAGVGRQAWPLSLLRALWAGLIEVEAGRRRGVMHEARWLNLAGFALRPGDGYPLDDWRVQQMWRWFTAGTVFPRNELCRAEWWVLWRRVAGGLGSGHQRAVAESCVTVWRPRRERKAHTGSHETAEVWRLLGSLELLPIPTKVEIGAHLFQRLERRLEPSLLRAAWWSLGRLGARVPAYGPLNGLLPVEVVLEWLTRITAGPPADPEVLFAVVQMARCTGDRYRDLPEDTREETLAWLGRHGAPEAQLALVREGGDLDDAAEEHVFGESLPPGLHLA